MKTNFILALFSMALVAAAAPTGEISTRLRSLSIHHSEHPSK